LAESRGGSASGTKAATGSPVTVVVMYRPVGCALMVTKSLLFLHESKDHFTMAAGV
jgi:hypothetical protein